MGDSRPLAMEAPLASLWLLPILLFHLSVAAPQETNSFPLLMPKVHPDVPETYLCTPVRVNTEEAYYIVGFAPNASMHTAHHILVFGCEEPGSDEPVWNCGEMSGHGVMQQKNMELKQVCKSGRSTQIIYAWAMGAPELKLPQGVGFRVGADSRIQYLVLQVHYASVDQIPKTGDDSGVVITFTEEEQPKTAGVLLMGTGGYAPAHSTTYFETACMMKEDQAMHPFAFRTHTHSLGKVVSGWRVRGNKFWSLLGKRDPLEPEMFYPVDNENVTIKRGDVVAARCTMVNHKDTDVAIGSTKQDEMCNFYLMYWVRGKDTLQPNTCFTRGPPTWSWGGEYGGQLQNIPDVEASIL